MSSLHLRNRTLFIELFIFINLPHLCHTLGIIQYYFIYSNFPAQIFQWSSFDWLLHPFEIPPLYVCVCVYVYVEREHFVALQDAFRLILFITCPGTVLNSFH